MAQILYHADPPEERCLVQLDGLTALFHRPSGTTHILAPPAPEILDALADGPGSPATILARLERKFALADDEGSLDALASRLAELERAGLVWQA